MLRRRAMDLLARREHTRQELEQKLLSRLRRDAQKLVDSEPAGTLCNADLTLEILGQVLDQLESDKLLSDARFAESFVSARSSKGYGPLYIRHQLRQKQLDDTLCGLSLESIDEEQWRQQLIVLLRRKLGDLPMPAPLSKDSARLQRFVLARGFTSAQWREVQKQWPQLLKSWQLH